jgi:hypothetical protein
MSGSLLDSRRSLSSWSWLVGISAGA